MVYNFIGGIIIEKSIHQNRVAVAESCGINRIMAKAKLLQNLSWGKRLRPTCNCRAQFVTRISKYLSGAKMRLECRDREGGHLTYTSEGETNSPGNDELKVKGDHEEVCEVAHEGGHLTFTWKVRPTTSRFVRLHVKAAT
ncbi:Pollen Ole e 1 allergen/extensin [Corchorus olitorius]|uniref:Pollen Ole e 1 allergen/extensin n=1 Tax=Corchorus olitorius TaxID=93759 RepID=A0A1R3H4L1_9ROSI|nr:Pollen Ole e 1 allergen/extensin [Corchorus olitorius]